MSKKPLAILLSTLMASVAIVGASSPAQANTTFNAANVALDFTKVMPFASAVQALRGLPKVELATTANIPDLDNLPAQIDGQTPDDGDLILVKDQVDPIENGVYRLTSGSLIRVVGYNNTGDILQGDHVFVDGGSVNEHTGWIQQIATPTIGIHNVVWASGLTQRNLDSAPDIGEDIPLNTVVNYLDVATIAGQAIDARITYIDHYGVSHSSTAGLLDKLDDADSDTGANRYINSDLGWDPSENVQDRFARFRVDFFKDLDSTPVAVTLQNLKLSIYDVDNLQAITVSGMPSHELATETILTASKVGNSIRVVAQEVNTSSDISGDPTGLSSFSQGRVSFAFDAISTFEFTLELSRFSNSSSASYSLDFGPGVDWGSRAMDVPGTVTFANAPVTTVPDPPTLATVVSGDGQLTATWTAGATGGEAITNYQYSLDNGASWVAINPASSFTNLVISGLSNGSTYPIRVRAVNSRGHGLSSNMIAGTPAGAGQNQVIIDTPYEGPILGSFSDRTLDPCTPKSITITGTKLSGAAGSIQGRAVTVLENTDTKLVIATPAGLTPARGVDLVVTSPYGTLTHQNAFDIPAGVCSQTLSKGRWTQIQSDGETVKMYAKDPIGDGKVQFFVDGKELAWITAVDAKDPKLSFASSLPYLVRSVDLKPGKNRFEIRVDGKRVWRTTYVPKG